MAFIEHPATHTGYRAKGLHRGNVAIDDDNLAHQSGGIDQGAEHIHYFRRTCTLRSSHLRRRQDVLQAAVFSICGGARETINWCTPYL